MRLTKSSGPGITLLFGALLLQTVQAQTHSEVLVVYNTNYADSLAVANHYMSQRNVPAANLCAITPPANDYLSLSDYTTYVKTPIQNCLNTLGQKNILYIVMSYLTPFVIGTGPFARSAIDSYLADIWDKYVSQPFLITPSVTQPYYTDSQSQGNVYNPFQSFATYRANARNPLIYSVWRLDAPTAAIASALVDQAIQAENQGGPIGQACIDRIYGDLTYAADAGYGNGDFDLYQAGTFLGQAGFTVVEDSNPAEFGTAPAPLTCPDTALYSGWYSYYNYNNAFTWQTGAIGWHLDSASALSPRSGSSWVPNALLNGITVTSGSVTEPYLQGLTRPGGTFRNLLEGARVGDAFLRNTRWLKWQIMYVGDPLYQPFGSGRVPFSPLQPVNSFQISPQEIVGGANTTGAITLSSAAPPGGSSFTLSAASGVSVPATVTVAAGATKASFSITTTAVTQSQFTVITATGNAVTLKNTIITDPLIGALIPSVGTTMAGFPVTVNLTLNGRAPTGGAVVNLSSDNPAITVPATVTFPAGATVTTFSASSIPVSSAVTANITASYAGAISRVGIAVVPAIQSITAAPATVNAGAQTVITVILGTNVPAGNTATVQLMSSDPASLPVPPTVMVPAGTNYLLYLATSSPGSSGKNVTISATYGGATASVMVPIN